MKNNFSFVPHSERTDAPAVEGWEPLSPPLDPSSEFPIHQECLQQFPKPFQAEAKKAWSILCELDQDSEAALLKPEVKTFVQEIGASGFVANMFVQERFKQLYPDAPLAKDCLPSWLQIDFLEKHKLAIDTSDVHREQEVEISELFDKAMKDLPYRDDPSFGRYYELAQNPQQHPKPQSFKYYIEKKALYTALKTGALPYALQELSELDFTVEGKLFDSDRFVLYGKGNVDQASRLTTILTKHGIAGRGPAQDVWSITQAANGALDLAVSYSNDTALGHGGRVTDELDYPLKTYDQKAFFEWYIKVCSYTGKSPMQPYRTSFVYALDDEFAHGPDKENVLKHAEALAGYPVLMSNTRLHS